MKEKTVYLKATVDTGATAFACEHLRMFPLEKLIQVTVIPMEYDAIKVSFLFETQPDFCYQIDVLNAFCVGFRGEGPWGLHDLMIEAGFPEETASKVFVISRYDKTVLKK